MGSEVGDKLADLFEPSEVKWKPQAVKGNRALAIAFIDARAVMDRLDHVVGVGGWETSYREMPDGVVCRLRVRIGEHWCEHEDVGSFSEQPDDGDKLKAAFSDALKRVAIHFGIGRYLYRLPSQWCDYDQAKRSFSRPPQLPAWAIPGKKEAAKKAPLKDPPKAKPAEQPAQMELLTRPYDADQAGAETIDMEQQLYLEQQCMLAGFSADAMCKRFKVSGFSDLCVEEYRFALDHLGPIVEAKHQRKGA